MGNFWINSNIKIRRSGVDNWAGCKIPVPTHWNVDMFAEMLRGYHDQNLIQFIKFGWPLDLSKVEKSPVIPRNQRGARENSGAVNSYLEKECQKGTIIGPFQESPFGDSARYSPLDAIPKRESAEFRVILNLSFPFEGGSVNDAISKDSYQGEEVNLTYPGVDDLVRLIRKKGRGALLFKKDILKCYRQIFMDPGVVHILGFSIDGKKFHDVVLSMGLKIACYICQKITNALMYIYRRLSFEGVNYLDDLGAAEVKRLAMQAYNTLTWLLQQLNIWEATSKACLPTTCLTFLGIRCDSIEFTLTITPDRLLEIGLLLDTWLTKSAATLREVQSLAGKLNFLCVTVRSGRVFMSRILDLLKRFKGSDRKLKVDEELKKDISWWKRFMIIYDGVSMFPEARWSRPDACISTDSCLSGCGGWSQGRFFHCEFPPFIDNLNLAINELECLAIVIALKLWGKDYVNSNLLLYCDNRVTVDVINKGRAANAFSQKCLREIVWLTANCNLWIKVCFLQGKLNRKSDFLSRWHLHDNYKNKFWQETIGGNIRETIVTEDMFKFSHDW